MYPQTPDGFETCGLPFITQHLQSSTDIISYGEGQTPGLGWWYDGSAVRCQVILPEALVQLPACTVADHNLF